MKIAILTSGILPVPAVQGGAVENFLDFFLEYNSIHQEHDITVYSVYAPQVKEHHALKSKVNHYYFINTDSFGAKLRKYIFAKRHRHYGRSMLQEWSGSPGRPKCHCNGSQSLPPCPYPLPVCTSIPPPVCCWHHC